MPDLNTGDILGAAAFIVVVLKQIFDFLGPRVKKNGNGTSGDKAPEYWEATFERVFERVLDRRNLLVRELIREEIEKAMKP